MTGHDTPRQESPAAQRKRIEAMMQDPEMQQVAATARPRGPERSPRPEHGNPDKQRMQRRLATMAKAAERDPEIEQRIKTLGAGGPQQDRRHGTPPPAPGSRDGRTTGISCIGRVG